MLGNPRTMAHFAGLLEAEGLQVEYDGQLCESRSAQQVLEWVGWYVFGKVVDKSAGRPVEAAIDATVIRVTEQLRELYPYLTISFDGEEHQPAPERFLRDDGDR